MRTYLLILMVSFVLAGCKLSEQKLLEIRQDNLEEWTVSVRCLNGVQYWMTHKHLAPKYSPDRHSPDTC